MQDDYSIFVLRFRSQPIQEIGNERASASDICSLQERKRRGKGRDRKFRLITQYLKCIVLCSGDLHRLTRAASCLGNLRSYPRVLLKRREPWFIFAHRPHRSCLIGFQILAPLGLQSRKRRPTGESSPSRQNSSPARLFSPRAPTGPPSTWDRLRRCLGLASAMRIQCGLVRFHLQKRLLALHGPPPACSQRTSGAPPHGQRFVRRPL